MADTMHNQDDNRQSLNENNDASTFEEPTWVGPVKVAVVVMGVMIVVGLGLLGYGLATGLGKSASAGDVPRSFAYPSNASLVETNAGADGSIWMRFQYSDGQQEMIVIDPAAQKIRARVQLSPSGEFGFIKSE